jgi:DNA-binding response OmpR family regulator
MSRLRKALKTASDENLDPIRTVRDGGYGLFTNKII